MWMMGCNGVGGFNNSDSFNRRKLRPLIPKPSPPTTTTCTSNGNITTNNIPILSNPPCLTRLHGTDLFLFNNHLSTVSEQSKGSEFMGLSPSTTTTTVVSSRWNPTPEQLSTLEELYRRGTRTPTADQIQHITAQLRRYGKIEGKNVFYWFQNHKARERQKRRRKSSELETSNITTNGEEKHQTLGQIGLLERNESGGSRRTGYEVEQTKNWQQLSTNCSTLSKEAVSMQGRATVVSESKTDGCFQLEDYDHQIQEFQHSRSSHLHATWHMMNLSSSSSSHLINPTTTTTKTLARSTTTDTHPQLRILFQPKFIHSNINDYQKSNTLELFPLLPKEEEDGNDTGNDEIMISGKGKEHLPNIPMVNTTTPYQFIEFL